VEGEQVASEGGRTYVPEDHHKAGFPPGVRTKRAAIHHCHAREQRRRRTTEQFERIRSGAGLGSPSIPNGSHRLKLTKVGVVNEEEERSPSAQAVLRERSGIAPGAAGEPRVSKAAGG
jgi:hypothetical protein